MKCSRCGLHPATVFFSQVKGDAKENHRLCEECAKKQEECPVDPNFTYTDSAVVGQIGQILETILTKKTPQYNDLQCPHCGISYSEFRKTGRFRCEYDYTVFEKPLEKVFLHIHGNSKHIGKIPPSFRESLELEKRISGLEKELKNAVSTENYEKAAEIRDQISYWKNKGKALEE